RATLGANAQCYRGSLNLEGNKHPLRHLVAVSEELSQIGAGKTLERVILFDDSPEYVWRSVAQVHGVPGGCAWAPWIVGELKRMRKIEPLRGIGCNPTVVKGPKGMFMNCISRGLRSGKLRFPDMNGPVVWDRVPISRLLSPESV